MLFILGNQCPLTQWDCQDFPYGVPIANHGVPIANHKVPIKENNIDQNARKLKRAVYQTHMVHCSVPEILVIMNYFQVY